MNHKGTLYICIILLLCFVGAVQASENTEAIYDQGVMLFESERYSEALEAFNKLIELDPQNADAWNYRGWSLWRMDRNVEALEACNKALEIDPNHVSAWTNRGV
ncbi:tetratricopeptide repeat protein, partial [Methanocalculus sp.]|uniref:tetratricopeptide repeat protein n=1 Tax=Methanocalculus sp. TaxID=2004547 RepID=UPI002625A2F2